MDDTDLNQIFYEDIEVVSDDGEIMEYTAFENEMQDDIGVSDIELDHFQFLSSTWYMFPHKAYMYMIQCIEGDIIPTGDMILDIDPQFINLDQATNDMEREALKNWKKYEASLAVRKLPNGEDRLHSKIPKYFHLILPFVEEWKKKLAHCHILPVIHI